MKVVAAVADCGSSDSGGAVDRRQIARRRRGTSCGSRKAPLPRELSLSPNLAPGRRDWDWDWGCNSGRIRDHAPFKAPYTGRRPGAWQASAVRESGRLSSGQNVLESVSQARFRQRSSVCYLRLRADSVTCFPASTPGRPARRAWSCIRGNKGRGWNGRSAGNDPPGCVRWRCGVATRGRRVWVWIQCFSSFRGFRCAYGRHG
jgi:hypothetical protein